MKYIELSARQIAEVSKTDKIIVEKSTLPVRTAEAIKNILDNVGNGVKFQILSNPESALTYCYICDPDFSVYISK